LIAKIHFHDLLRCRGAAPRLRRGDLLSLAGGRAGSFFPLGVRRELGLASNLFLPLDFKQAQTTGRRRVTPRRRCRRGPSVSGLILPAR
jgi:hypothetical protein